MSVLDPILKNAIKNTVEDAKKVREKAIETAKQQLNDVLFGNQSFGSQSLYLPSVDQSELTPKPLAPQIDEWSVKSWGTLLDEEGKRKVKLFLKISKLMGLILSNRSIDKQDTEPLIFAAEVSKTAQDFSPATKISYECKILKPGLEVTLLGGYQDIYTKVKDILVRFCSNIEPTKEELIFLNEEYKRESPE